MCINHININTVVEDNLLLSIYNDQVVSTYFQTVEHSEFVKKVVLAEILKLNDLVINKNHQDQTQFSPEKKTLEKKIGLLLSAYSLSAITQKSKQNKKNKKTKNIVF